jgi:hypothetical protein
MPAKCATPLFAGTMSQTMAVAGLSPVLKNQWIVFSSSRSPPELES